jgi:hypothetical protein
MVRDPAERRVSIIGYLGITNIGRKNQNNHAAPQHRSFHFAPSAVIPIITKISRPPQQWGKLLLGFEKFPHFRLISSHPFQVIPKNRR